ncbi:glycosyltransferase family 39 protein [Afifella sp. JA880]|uniref:ArnT family glycosyltransferase n=1 Tax=Afifella sp. JA880 TaxID=2975280 RepID=UPI0021BB9841|nr:glycosyltransferase family 39 protein [Afifella sp. JA880]MCT8265710.1 glycosyltransferase family 39 protein [Afifella sp. JA880]
MSEAPLDARRSRLIGWLSRFAPLAGLVTILVAIILFLPGLTALPPIDRDEARFVQATKQMHESGDFIDIHFQSETRYKKPVGIYWLQAAATAPFGGAEAPIWAYRIPSAVGAVLAVLATYLAGLSLFGRRAAFIGSLLMSATILLGVEARLAKTDAVLLALTVFAQAIMARAWMSGRGEAEESAGLTAPPSREPLSWPLALAFWIALGAGILVKGPVIVMVCGLTLISLMIGSRSFVPLLRLRPLPGLVAMLIVTLPWFVAITLLSDGAFFGDSVGHDLMAKVASGQESHGAPPGTYLGLFFATAWPLTPFALLALPMMIRQWRHPDIFFCLVWIVPAWLVFEAVPTKLPHYVLPLYPAFSLLAGAAMVRGAVLTRASLRIIIGLLAAAVPVFVAIGIVVLPLYLEKRLPAGADVAAVAAAVMGLLAARALMRGRDERAVAASVLSAALLYIGAFQLAFPGLDAIRVSERAVAEAEKVSSCSNPELAATGYTEPSLVFFGGTDVVLGSSEDVAKFLEEPGCRVGLVEARRDAEFHASVAADGLTVVRRGEVSGYNYSRGRPVTVGIYETGPAAQ